MTRLRQVHCHGSGVPWHLASETRHGSPAPCPGPPTTKSPSPEVSPSGYGTSIRLSPRGPQGRLVLPRSTQHGMGGPARVGDSLAEGNVCVLNKAADPKREKTRAQGTASPTVPRTDAAGRPLHGTGLLRLRWHSPTLRGLLRGLGEHPSHSGWWPAAAGQEFPVSIEHSGWAEGGQELPQGSVPGWSLTSAQRDPRWERRLQRAGSASPLSPGHGDAAAGTDHTLIPKRPSFRRPV